MIVRTYARRTRDISRNFSDPALLVDDDSVEAQGSQDFPEIPLTQQSSQDRFNFAAAFSSQDSSPWSLDPDSVPPLPTSNSLRRPGKKPRNSSRKARDAAAEATAAPAVSSTATLMEAQEFGEMMEHVDEVNFALDGLRPGQPARIRRASLLSLLSICGTTQQRRLLRAQGMAKRIIDSILDLNFDDSPNTLAAATLFFVFASDVQDDLLDSPPCIHFLLKLLNPPVTGAVEGRAPTIGSKLLGMLKPQVLSVTNKGMDSSSRTILSKVQEILLSCKEIKSGATDRPELSSKWISLLTMEKACLSTVSFEDTSESVTKAMGNFKERLRELGGLDAIFDVVISCYSTMERWLKCRSPSVSELKDGATLESVVLLLKCLKILENATFLSKDNQDHLLGMRGRPEGLSTSFVGVVVSSVKILSDLALLQSPLNICNKGKSTYLPENVDSPFSHASQVQVKDKKRGNVAFGGVEGSKKRSRTCDKWQKLSASSSELFDFGSEMVGAFGRDLYSIKNKAECNESDICDGTLSGPNGGSYINTNGSKVKRNANGLKMNLKSNGFKVDSDNSGKHSHWWIFTRATGSKADSCRQSKRPHMSEDVKDECTMDSYDPFEFDEGEFELSKWEKLARKKDTSQTLQSTVINKEHGKGYDDFSIDTDPMLSQSNNGDSYKSREDDCPSVTQEDSNLLEDCLLASVKVLMNLTNDNPLGCQQIGACGGLDTMVSLIINHFPSYDLSLPMHSRLKEDTTSSNPSTSAGHSNKKHLTDYALDFLVAILGLLVNLVEKDSQNRLRLASARVLVEGPGISEIEEKYRHVIPLLCSIFLTNQGAGEAAGEGKLLLCDDEALMQGEQEAEMMIIEAYAALLLAFLSTESSEVRDAIATYLPNHNLEALVPVLERFVAFHLQLNMISPETHSAVMQVIESCRGTIRE